ncbi:MAG: prolyl oligopeptidase family serine peptidase [Myxococcota bacterium]|nr:prolyl oligopeptidase family serine peptidase [Myxococcota bacterium]
MRILILLLIGSSLSCSALSQQATKSPQGLATSKDPFLWLEEIEGEKALNWVHKQNALSLPQFESDPRYGEFLSQADKILNAKDKIPYGALRAGYVYNFWQDEKNIRGLWRRTSFKSYQGKEPKWENLLDLDALANKEEENWVYKGVSCLPPTFERCMLRLSRGGTDASVYREFNLKSKTFVKDGFVVPEAKSSVHWIDKDTLLVGTDFGENTLTDSGYPRIVKRWQRGTPLNAAQTIYSGEQKDMGIWPYVIHEPRQHQIMILRYKTFYTGESFVLSNNQGLMKLPIPESAEFKGHFKDHFLFSLREAWQINDNTYPQGALLAFSSQAFKQTGALPAIHTLLIPDERSSIQRVNESKNKLFVSIIRNVKGQILEFDFYDKKQQWNSAPVDLPKQGTLSVSSANPFSDEIFVNYEDHITPDKLYSYSSKAKKSQVIKTLPERFDANNLQVHQYEATSKDGTRIPYFIIHEKNIRLNGKNPTILYGYGGFEISMKPRYSSIAGKLWLERGGVYAIANIRGGGEFGPRWHKGALKEKRQNGFDDFAAVAQDLIARKITSPQKLGIMGGSNGGLLTGVSFTQQPELFGAVVCQVPLLDMLRYNKLLAGASWMAEYGDPDDASMGAFIKTYSPYHNVHAQKRYPKVFFVTSTKDDRVHPGHARKMVAKMQALGHDVVYYENTEGGHAAGANLKQHAKRYALEYTYFSQQLRLD